MTIEPDQALRPHPTLPRYYGSEQGRLSFVRELFDETAPWYESISGVLSFGSGSWYRREALRRAGYTPGMKLLDVATGTGVVARAARAIGGPVVGLDPSIGMLIAGRQVARTAAVQAVGERLPFADSSFEMLSIGYAMRHLSDLRAAFAEHLRVLRPGGRILILEITPPKSRLGYLALRTYMNDVVPPFVRLLTRNRETETLMRYYWDTIRECVPPAEILGALRDAGFERAERRVSFGVMSDYTGVKPG
jgi:demethylmenaquinone methyltransferase/2-methoxy-6-polyprenyl-1,4-benzoquinol methylase